MQRRHEQLPQGDWHSFETNTAPVRPFASAFCGFDDPHLLTVARLGREPMAVAVQAHSG